MSGLLCAGDLYINRFNALGQPTKSIDVGNARQFQLQESSELRERKSKRRANYGQSLNSVYIKQPTQLQIVLDDINKTNLAIALLGTDTPVSVSAGSATDEPVVGQLGGWVRFANKNITQGTVEITDSTSTTTYVEGTDYEVNYHVGMFRALPGGSITESEDLLASYDHGGVTGSIIAGGAQPIIRSSLFLDGKNLATGELVLVDVFDTSLTPNSPVDFLADEFVTLQLDGRPTTPPGKDAPYEVNNLVAG